MPDRIIQRGLWLDSALDEMRRDLEEDRFVSAVGHFREALGLSRGLPQLKARVNEHAEIHSEELLPRNWRVAETLLQEAAATEPALTVDPELLAKLKQARQEERVSIALQKADRLASDGKTADARDRLAELLAAYPDETRIQQRLNALDPPPPAAPAPVVVEAAEEVPLEPVAVTSQVLADDETGSQDAAPGFSEIPNPWQTKVLISSSAWNAIKDLAAVVATVAMLGTAGFLVWRHFSEPPARPQPSRSLPPPGMREPARAADTPATTTAPAGGAFEDVPAPPSDQDDILRAVRAFSETSGKNIGNEVVDEVDIQGKQAKVRFRPKDKSSAPNLVFSLVRQADGWKVEKAQ